MEATNITRADRLALSPAEVAHRTGIGRNRVYAALKTGELRCIRLGRRIVVPVEEVTKWLDAQVSGR